LEALDGFILLLDVVGLDGLSTPMFTDAEAADGGRGMPTATAGVIPHCCCEISTYVPDTGRIAIIPGRDWGGCRSVSLADATHSFSGMLPNRFRATSRGMSRF